MNQVKDNMTRDLVTVRWDDPMAEASSLMEEQRIRHLPVTDAEGKVIGILSDRDVKLATNPSRPGFAAKCVVGDYMSWPALSVPETMALDKVAEGMVDEKLSAFLVTGKEKEVVGIITSEDLLRHLVSVLRDEKPSTWAQLPYTPIVRQALRTAENLGI